MVPLLDDKGDRRSSFDSDEEGSYGWGSPTAAKRALHRRAGHLGVKELARPIVTIVALLVVGGWYWATRPPSDPWTTARKWKGIGGPRLESLNALFEVRRGRVEVNELLTPQAPARSFYDSLRPDLRYLTCDSWSGLTGQFTSALALLHLAQMTQRVAIIPSWRDDGHYGPVIARMSTLFNLDRLRDTGLLFVEWDDIKPSRLVEDTPIEDLGCFKASWFENALTFGDHNVRQTVWDVPRPGEATAWSYESFTLYDYEHKTRLAGARKLSNITGIALPRNIAEETADAGLLCYTNIWDLQHAGEGIKKGAMTSLLSEPLRGQRPEWYGVGRYIDFAPAIWDVALACVHRTLRVKKLPPLLTVHIRRGDFLDLCSRHTDCTPTLDAYTPKVNAMLEGMPKNTKVLVTSDETTDLEFLAGIDALGWHRIDHLALGTAARLAEVFGDSSRWADSAVDQALLSLGARFVGTEGSQVSEISALRVQSWNGGKTVMVPRPA